MAQRVLTTHPVNADTTVTNPVTAAPTTDPKSAQARSDGRGIVSASCDTNAIGLVMYYWNSKLGNGRWVLADITVAASTRTVDQYGTATWLVPENTPICVKASGACVISLGGVKDFAGNTIGT